MPPLGATTPEDFDAFDVFAGFIVLDALIANRDRHDENWSVLIPAAGEGPRRLCGSYDQAGSLGYNLRDAERLRRLQEPGGVRGWASRGTAWRLDHVDRPVVSLVQAASEVLGMASQAARAYWLGRIVSMETHMAEGALSQVPEMSALARTFAVELLETNRRRLLDECH